MRLYIADDNVAFAEFCAEVARREGWTVTICSNGAELLELLRLENGPALLLVDINMPVLDGIEAIDGLRDIARTLRIRFITGGADSFALAARMIANAHDLQTGKFLTKPVSTRALRDVLSTEAQILEKTQSHQSQIT